MKKEIQTMTKSDLQQFVKISDQHSSVGNQLRQSLTEKIVSREQMIACIIQICPETKQELKEISYDDIKQIYDNIVKQPNVNKNVSQSKNKNQKNDIKKRKQLQNRLPNVHEIKKILIDRLPEYRNQIRNLSVQQVISMWNKLENQKQMNQKDPRKTTPQLPNYSQTQGIASYNSMYSSDVPAMPNILTTPVVPKPVSKQMYRFEDDQIEEDGIRRRGRPRKIKQGNSRPFGYDDAPNYSDTQIVKESVPKNYGYANQFKLPDYIAGPLYQPEPQKIFHQTTPYDQPVVASSTKASTKLQLNKSQASSSSSASKDNNPEVFDNKQNGRHLKNKYKCKITFYLNQSDLQQQQKQCLQNQQQKGDKAMGEQQRKKKNTNALAQIIQSLHHTFKNKTWKIQ